MGSIKKMIEEAIPGIDVLSLMIGKTVIQVLSTLLEPISVAGLAPKQISWAGI